MFFVAMPTIYSKKIAERKEVSSVENNTFVHVRRDRAIVTRQEANY